MTRNDAFTRRLAIRWSALRHVAMNVLADFARAAA
jgi:hypothetical protein